MSAIFKPLLRRNEGLRPHQKIDEINVLLEGISITLNVSLVLNGLPSCHSLIKVCSRVLLRDVSARDVGCLPRLGPSGRRLTLKVDVRKLSIQVIPSACPLHSSTGLEDSGNPRGRTSPPRSSRRPDIRDRASRCIPVALKSVRNGLILL